MPRLTVITGILAFRNATAGTLHGNEVARYGAFFTALEQFDFKEDWVLYYESTGFTPLFIRALVEFPFSLGLCDGVT